MNVQADTPLAMKARPCEDNPVVPAQTLSWRRALRLAVGAVAAFHLAGPLELEERGRLPLDHWLVPLSVFVTAVIVLWLSGKALLSKCSKL